MMLCGLVCIDYVSVGLLVLACYLAAWLLLLRFVVDFGVCVVVGLLCCGYALVVWGVVVLSYLVVVLLVVCLFYLLPPGLLLV